MKAKSKNSLFRTVALAIVAASAVTAHASLVVSANWDVIAGGGGTCSGGRFSITGTVGQAAVGASSSANRSLVAGFWADSVVQTPGAPTLTLTRSGSNIVLSWPATWSGYVL